MEERDERKKNINTIIITLLICAVFLGIMLIQNAYEAKKEQQESMKTVLVTDNDRYFTVISCAKKFLNYVQTGTTDDILLLLNEEYKDLYMINENNIRNFVPALEDNYIYDYVGGEMYSKRISKSVVEYYVKGKIKASQLDEDSTYRDYDVTIILYEDKMLFSVKPGIGGLES